MVTLSRTYAGTKAEYEKYFANMEITKLKREAEQVIATMVANRARYQSVSSGTGVPWFVIAIIHSLEGGANFSKHLHNGDPLTGRTVRVPAGRPVAGIPPFTWEASATDALVYKDMHKWKDWSIGGIMWNLERYNGFGYRTSRVAMPTPYLWSGSNHYTSGKYVADGRFSASAVSQQVGAAVIIKMMIDKGIITASGADGTNSAGLGLNYGLGCADGGIAGNKTLMGAHNPSSAAEALAYALGINAADRQRQYQFSALIDVAYAPQALTLDAQKTFQLRNMMPDADELNLTIEDVVYYFGDNIEAEVTAYAADPNAPSPQVFMHDSANPVTNTPGQAPPSGTIQDRIYKAAIATKGQSSRNGPGGGNVACAWILNTAVFPKAGIAPIGKNQNLVSSVEEALKESRGQLISPRTAGGPGDVVVMGTAHIGICLNEGCSQVISNSSSKASFTWVASIQAYDSYYKTSSRVYRVVN
jgi:lysozyme family protein